MVDKVNMFVNVALTSGFSLVEILAIGDANVIVVRVK